MKFLENFAGLVFIYKNKTQNPCIIYECPDEADKINIASENVKQQHSAYFYKSSKLESLL